MLYDILKDFKGSQDGRFSEDFKAGTQRELSDYLVSCIPADWARRSPAPKVSSPEAALSNKAITSDGSGGDGSGSEAAVARKGKK